jgi:hypothetical protein
MSIRGEIKRLSPVLSEQNRILVVGQTCATAASCDPARLLMRHRHGDSIAVTVPTKSVLSLPSRKVITVQNGKAVGDRSLPDVVLMNGRVLSGVKVSESVIIDPGNLNRTAGERRE